MVEPVDPNANAPTPPGLGSSRQLKGGVGSSSIGLPSGPVKPGTGQPLAAPGGVGDAERAASKRQHAEAMGKARLAGAPEALIRRAEDLKGQELAQWKQRDQLTEPAAMAQANAEMQATRALLAQAHQDIAKATPATPPVRSQAEKTFVQAMVKARVDGAPDAVVRGAEDANANIRGLQQQNAELTRRLGSLPDGPEQAALKVRLEAMKGDMDVAKRQLERTMNDLRGWRGQG